MIISVLIQELSSGTESHDLSKDEEASHKEELADTSKESGEYDSIVLVDYM